MWRYNGVFQNIFGTDAEESLSWAATIEHMYLPSISDNQSHALNHTQSPRVKKLQPASPDGVAAPPAAPAELYARRCAEAQCAEHPSLMALLSRYRHADHINVLNLSTADVGPEDVMTLLGVLQHFPMLEYLGLAGCRLRSSEIVAVTGVLRHHPSIKAVDLERNPFSSMGIKLLLETVQFNRNLTDLQYDGRASPFGGFLERKLQNQLEWNRNRNGTRRSGPADDRLKDMDQEMQRLKEQLQTMQQTLQDRDVHVRHLSEALQALQSAEQAMEDRDGQMQHLTRQMEAKDQQEQQLRDQLQTLQGTLQERDEEMQRLKEQLQTMQQTLQDRDAHVRHLSEALQSAEQAMEDRDAHVRHLSGALQSAEQALQSAQQAMEDRDGQMQHLTRQMEAKDQQEQQLRDQLQTLQGTLQERDREMQRLKDRPPTECRETQTDGPNPLAPAVSAAAAAAVAAAAAAEAARAKGTAAAAAAAALAAGAVQAAESLTKARAEAEAKAEADGAARARHAVEASAAAALAASAVCAGDSLAAAEASALQERVGASAGAALVAAAAHAAHSIAQAEARAAAAAAQREAVAAAAAAAVLAGAALTAEGLAPPAPPWIGFMVKSKKGRGVVIEDVAEGGPAAEAGLMDGDLMVSFGGDAVGDMRAFWRAMKAHKRIGNTIPVVVERARPDAAGGSSRSLKSAASSGALRRGGDAVTVHLTVGVKRRKVLANVPPLRTVADVAPVLADPAALELLVQSGFGAIDDDASGLISEEEYNGGFRRWLGPELSALVPDQRVKELWDVADEDGSGFLKLEEFRVLVHELLPALGR